MLRNFPLFAVAVSALAQQPLRMTDLQIVGSHNSYHAGIASSESALLKKSNPAVYDALDYRHPPIDQQLSAGVRQIEIDVYGDTNGGLFANPAGPAQVAKAGLPADPPFDPTGVMKKPGFKVLHVQDLDYRSNCQPFIQCLKVVRDWSKAHPGHLPIYILVENKDQNPRPDYMVQPEKLTPATFDALDAEIRSVFAASEMITPDDVRGKHKTLEEAVLSNGWPALDKARSKVVFLLDQRRVGPLYTAGHPSLEGRVLFTNAQPGKPDAAFIQMNNPLPTADNGKAGDIPTLVKKGYLIRTMTDGGPAAVRANDTTRRDAALNGGAQLLSTDYPFGERAPSGFSVQFETGIARCNPVTGSKVCTGPALLEPR